MKTKYYVSIKEWFGIYWMVKDGISYNVCKGRVYKDKHGDYDWLKLIEKGIIREVQLEEIALLF